MVDIADRRRGPRRREIGPHALVRTETLQDKRGSDRRQGPRRRGDAHSIAEALAATPNAGTPIKTFQLGKVRRSLLYDCGCVAVEPGSGSGRLQLLECPTHAALEAQLRRRRTDRH